MIKGVRTGFEDEDDEVVVVVVIEDDEDDEDVVVSGVVDDVLDFDDEVVFLLESDFTLDFFTDLDGARSAVFDVDDDLPHNDFPVLIDYCFVFIFY